MRIIYFLPHFAPLLLASFFFIGVSPREVDAQTRFRSPQSRTLDHLRRQEHRRLYQPRIKAVRAPGQARVFRAGQAIPYEFYAVRGGVSKIEVRSGLKVLKTIYPGNAPRGRGRIVLRLSDFARAGADRGKLRFKLWAWQGRASYRSVHGESVGYTLIP